MIAGRFLCTGACYRIYMTARDRIVTVEVQPGPLAGPILRERMATFVGVGTEGLTDAQVLWKERAKRWYDMSVPRLPFRDGAWTVYYGVITIALRVPRLDGTGLRPIRAGLLIVDRASARTVLGFSERYKYGSLWLMYSESENKWYARMHFRYDKGETVGREPRRRWVKAPDGYPRDAFGDPVPARSARGKAYLARNSE